MPRRSGPRCCGASNRTATRATGCSPSTCTIRPRAPSNSVPQPGRSSTGEVAGQLAAFVQDVLHKTGARKVDLVGNSRGANTIRNYVKNFGGARLVEKVVLGGGVDHGVIRSTTYLVGSEFNGLRPVHAGAQRRAPGDRARRALPHRPLRPLRQVRPAPTAGSSACRGSRPASPTTRPRSRARSTSSCPASITARPRSRRRRSPSPIGSSPAGGRSASPSCPRPHRC